MTATTTATSLAAAAIAAAEAISEQAGKASCGWPEPANAAEAARWIADAERRNAAGGPDAWDSCPDAAEAILRAAHSAIAEMIGDSEADAVLDLREQMRECQRIAGAAEDRIWLEWLAEKAEPVDA
jgi:hypothetical protein